MILLLQTQNEAVRLLPNDALAFVNRGGAYVGKKDYMQAITNSTRAIELDPKCADAYLNRGSAYACLNKFPEAIQDCDRGIEIDPKRATFVSSPRKSALPDART